MKKKILSIFKYCFFFGIGVFLVWWQFDKMTRLQKEQFSDSLRHANYWLIIPVIFMAILSHISRSVRWKILIEPLGYHPSTANTFYSVMSGYVVNTFIPRLGEVIKCSLLGKYEKIPVNKLVGTILVERAFDLICYLVFILITILIQISYVSHFIHEKLSTLSQQHGRMPFWGKPLIFVILAIAAFFIITWILRRFAHLDFIKKLNQFSKGLGEGLNTIRYLKNRGWFIAHTIFIWTMYLLEIYVGFFALSPTSHLGIEVACSVLSLATLGMIVSPGGIGAFPLAVQEVLLLYNVDNVSFGWLIWGVSTAIIIVIGLISLTLLVYKKKIKNETEPGYPG